jgi:hypothetical protein
MPKGARHAKGKCCVKLNQAVNQPDRRDMGVMHFLHDRKRLFALAQDVALPHFDSAFQASSPKTFRLTGQLVSLFSGFAVCRGCCALTT